MKQIDLSHVLRGLIKEREGNNISAAARKLEVSPQLLGMYVRGRRPPNVKFIQKWKQVYGDDLLNYIETPIETKVSPLNNRVKADTANDSAYRDILIESLQRNIQFLEQTVQTNLIGISDNIVVSRATIRAAIDYQLMKDSKGDEKKRVVLLEQINKLIHLQLTGGRKDHSVGV